MYNIPTAIWQQFMPILASGLCLYWGGSNHSTIIHTVIICRIDYVCLCIDEGKYGPVIGYKIPTTWRFRLRSYKTPSESPVANHIAVFPLVHDQVTDFCQMINTDTRIVSLCECE